jgi:hypothetical protein
LSRSRSWTDDAGKLRAHIEIIAGRIARCHDIWKVRNVAFAGLKTASAVSSRSASIAASISIDFAGRPSGADDEGNDDPGSRGLKVNAR